MDKKVLFRAHEFLVYLGTLVGRNLCSLSELGDGGDLRRALYLDLSRCWHGYEGAAFTRTIHVDWRDDGLDLGMVTRSGRSLVHGAACGHEILAGERIGDTDPGWRADR